MESKCEIRKLGFMVAMEIEAEPLIRYFSLKKSTVHGFDVYENDDICLIISEVGIINSTLATYILIRDLKCRKIINYGVAGFTNESYRHCSVISVGRVFKRDVDFTALGCEPYRFPDKPPYIQLETDSRLPICDCYTSDEYIGPKSNVPKDVLVDMEAYCVAAVCEKYDIPCLIYKSISDITANENTQEQIDTYLKSAVDAICDYIIDKVLNKAPVCQGE